MFNKTLLVLSMLASLANVAVQADDTAADFRLAPRISSKMLRWNLDASLLNGFTITGGDVVVDAAAKTITLTLSRHPFCPAGRMCPMFMPAPTVASLPLKTYRQKDSCGSIKYQAVRMLSPGDGVDETLTVVDNTGNHCPHFVALADTTVNYTVSGFNRMTGKSFKEVSTLEGDRLLPLFDAQ